jgi:hypothetical protein
MHGTENLKKIQFYKLDPMVTRLTFIFGDSRVEKRPRYPICYIKVLFGLKMAVTPLKQNTATSSADLSIALRMIVLWEVWQFFLDKYLFKTLPLSSE